MNFLWLSGIILFALNILLLIIGIVFSDFIEKHQTLSNIIFFSFKTTFLLIFVWIGCVIIDLLAKLVLPLIK